MMNFYLKIFCITLLFALFVVNFSNGATTVDNQSAFNEKVTQAMKLIINADATIKNITSSKDTDIISLPEKETDIITFLNQAKKYSNDVPTYLNSIKTTNKTQKEAINQINLLNNYIGLKIDFLTAHLKGRTFVTDGILLLQKREYEKARNSFKDAAATFDSLADIHENLISSASLVNESVWSYVLPGHESINDIKLNSSTSYEDWSHYNEGLQGLSNAFIAMKSNNTNLATDELKKTYTIMKNLTSSEFVGKSAINWLKVIKVTN